MKKLLALFVFMLLLLQMSAQTRSNYKYLFTAHTYMGESIIDSRLIEFDKSGYDNIWLGGDICSETLMLRSNLDYLDEHLRIGQPHNYFSLGNHDRRNGNIEYFEEFIGKKAYYADYYNGFTSIVLDTNLEPGDCENLNNQYKMICNVTDTISASSHLIMFFHWGLWSGVPGLPEPSVYAHTNLKYWNANCDSTNNNFAQIIYPLLVEVQNRGVNVICIMGDMGASYKKFEAVSSDGIQFLGCGLDNIKYYYEPDQWWTKEKDVVLEFNHNTTTKDLTWKFMDIDSLLDIQHGYNYLTKLTFDDIEAYPEENLTYLSHENYLYNINTMNDSVVIVDTTVQSLEISNNQIVFNGVFKSSVAGGQVSLVLQLINNSELVEEIEIQIIDIPSVMKYYETTFSPVADINSVDSIQFFIRNTSDLEIFLNNIILKYRD
jgi:hypothetical protein